MFKEMRRKDRELNSNEISAILKNSNYGILSTISENGYPYGVPVSFIYHDDYIYFHGALRGHKLDNIANNNKVSFCVVGHTCVLPAEFSTKFESVIIFGEAFDVDGDEKNSTLLEIINKYSPDFINQGKEYIQKANKATKVMKIKIEFVTGKAKK